MSNINVARDGKVIKAQLDADTLFFSPESMSTMAPEQLLTLRYYWGVLKSEASKILNDLEYESKRTRAEIIDLQVKDGKTKTAASENIYLDESYKIVEDQKRMVEYWLELINTVIWTISTQIELIKSIQ